ncbi:MAG TPA: glycosyltransferase [Chitinophagaceae bacterium]|nr:glycosyltransferase [Chitinophagaceae bacterium]
MKVQLLARPDHSLFLYEYLRKKIAVQLITFNVAKKGSLLHRLRKTTRVVSDDVVILNDLTIYDQMIFGLAKVLNFSPFRAESLYSEISFRRKAKRFKPDLIHYWPVYCHQYVKKQRENKQVSTLADVYSAHPQYVIKMLAPVYEEYNLNIKDSYFFQDASRNTEFLAHENFILVNSQYVKESFQRENLSKDIFVAEYGFWGDADAMSNYQAASGYRHMLNTPTLKLVYVGGVSLEKGVPYLLEALKKLGSASIELDIIGRVKKGQEKIFNKYHTLSGVKFLGPKPNNEIRNMLKKYSVLVLPSLTDAYSISVIEGLQQALPVIVSDQTGNKDDVKKFNTGEVVIAADSDSLIKAIEKMTVAEYREHLSRNIQNFIKSDLGDPYPEKVLRIYHQLIPKK